MNRWEHVEDVFHKVTDLPAGDQTRAVNDLCGNDTWVRARVLELVHADRDATSHSLAHIEESAARVRTQVESGAGPRALPERIGEFAIRARLGQGGFGTVYLAEQQHPVRRTVALKVIRAGFDTDLILARFESERRTLALLDHPNIARMINAGQTEDGLPYFSMEFVDGQPITTYCDENRFTIDSRIRLFVGVCRAIQHAHQKGVVHRDIKPGNVLVTQIDSTPIAKVIDFGIAKVLHATDDWGATLASVGQLIGTPEYMSPEQARTGGQEVDTRSDVYALGVLLHELLTGVLPFDRDSLRKVGPVNACRIIAEMDPPSPTQRLRDCAQTPALAQSRRLDTHAALLRAIKGDLAIIIAKAMSREPAHRYAGAEDLAADIDRFLRKEPIAARGPGVTYRARKFISRNRTALAATLTTCLLIGALAWGVQRSIAARHLAAEQSQRAKAQAYEDMISANALAGTALARGDEPAARAALLNVPEPLRGWEWRVLRGQLRDSRVLRPDQWTPLSMKCDPSGQLIATGSYYKRVDVFRADTGTQVLTLSEDGSPTWSPAGVAWSPDGSVLAAGIPDAIWIGDPRSPDSARRIPLKGLVTTLAWSHDATRLACIRRNAGPDDGVCVLNALTGEVIVQRLGPHVHNVLLHPTRPIVLWGDIAGYLHAYDYTAMSEVLNTRVCGDGINTILLTPDGARIAVAASCRAIAFFDANSLALVDKFKTPRSVTDMAFSTDGVWLYAATNTNLIDVLSATTGSFSHSFYGGDSYTQALCVNPVNGLVYSSGPNSQVRVRDDKDGNIDLGLGAGGSMPTSLLNGNRVIVQEDTRDARPGAPQGTLRVFDTATGAMLDSVPTAESFGWGWFTSGVPSDDNRFWSLRSGSLVQRDITTHQDVCSFSVPPAIGLHALRGSPRMILTLWRGGWLVLDANTGDVLKRVTLPPTVSVETLTNDGQRVQCVEPALTGLTSRNGVQPTASFTLRDLWTGEPVTVFEPCEYGGYFSFNDDNSLCVAGGESVNVHDAHTGVRIATLLEQPGDYTWVHFVDHGKRIIASGPTGRTHVWDTSTWRSVATFPDTGILTVLEDDTAAVIGSDRLLRLYRPDDRPLSP